MTQHMTDQTVLGHIGRLVAVEKKLYAQGTMSDGERARLNQIGVELDRCWDLLRQRRALRDAGRDPSGARVRNEGTVEGYRQ